MKRNLNRVHRKTNTAPAVTQTQKESGARAQEQPSGLLQDHPKTSQAGNSAEAHAECQCYSDRQAIMDLEPFIYKTVAFLDLLTCREILRSEDARDLEDDCAAGIVASAIDLQNGLVKPLHKLGTQIVAGQGRAA